MKYKYYYTLGSNRYQRRRELAAAIANAAKFAAWAVFVWTSFFLVWCAF